MTRRLRDEDLCLKKDGLKMFEGEMISRIIQYKKRRDDEMIKKINYTTKLLNKYTNKLKTKEIMINQRYVSFMV